MKKTLIALAALAATGAFAQSSVSLTGTIDANVTYGSTDTGNNVTKVGNSGLASSEFRFSGVEDLGGGLKVGFIYASGIGNDTGAGASSNTTNTAAGGLACAAATTSTASPDTTLASTCTVSPAGSQGLTFNRLSIIRVMGGFGEIKAGRDYTPVFWTEAIYDPFGINGVGTSRVFAGSNAGYGIAAVRASNSIGYVSPTMSGLSVWAQTSMGENLSTAASNKAGDGMSIQVTYNGGALNMAAGYGKTNISNGVDAEVSNYAASYNLGVATIMGYAQKNKKTGAVDVDGFLIGGKMPVGKGTIRASYSTTDNGTAKTNQTALGYVYDFSKTVSAYGTFASVSNSGGATAVLNGATGIANASSTGFDIGVAKKF